MIDFLRDYGISNDTLLEMTKKYNEALLFDLSCNEDDCLKILSYMKEIGIKNVDQILLYRIDPFMMTFESFVKKLGKCNVMVLVDLINNDCSAIDAMFEM